VTADPAKSYAALRDETAAMLNLNADSASLVENLQVSAKRDLKPLQIAGRRSERNFADGSGHARRPSFERRQCRFEAA
jgi:hypothetical protein